MPTAAIGIATVATAETTRRACVGSVSSTKVAAIATKWTVCPLG